MVSVKLCRAIAEATGKPTKFELGTMYYEKDTGLRYVCQDIFASGPSMVRIGGGSGKARVMNPDWFVRVLTDSELYKLVKYEQLGKHVIVVDGETKITHIKFSKPEDVTYEYREIPK